MIESIWTEARIEELKALWAKGDSAAIIAEKMSLTRNAVLGKVHRLGLEKRSNRNGWFYSSTREVKDRVAPKRIHRKSVFKSPDRKPTLRVESSRPPLLAVMSTITGNYMNVVPRRKFEPEYTKDQLRAMLTQAVKNTAAMRGTV